MVQRPVAVTVFSVLNILFGLMAVLCSPLQLLQMRGAGMGTLPGGSPNPAAVMFSSPSMKAYIFASTAIGVVLGIIAIAAAILMFSMKNLGRLLAIVYSVGSIIMAIVGGVFTMSIMPKMMQSMGLPQEAAGIGMAAGMVGGVIGSCFSLILPLLQLYFMTKRDVVEAFEMAENPPQFYDNEPPAPPPTRGEPLA